MRNAYTENSEMNGVQVQEWRLVDNRIYKYAERLFLFKRVLKMDVRLPALQCDNRKEHKNPRSTPKNKSLKLVRT